MCFVSIACQISHFFLSDYGKCAHLKRISVSAFMHWNLQQDCWSMFQWRDIPMGDPVSLFQFNIIKCLLKPIMHANTCHHFISPLCFWAYSSILGKIILQYKDFTLQAGIAKPHFMCSFQVYCSQLYNSIANKIRNKTFNLHFPLDFPKRYSF